MLANLTYARVKSGQSGLLPFTAVYAPGPSRLQRHFLPDCRRRALPFLAVYAPGPSRLQRHFLPDCRHRAHHHV